MNRYEYKEYWIEIFLEGDELEDCEDPLYYVPYIEFPHEEGVATTGDRYVTIQEARQGAERFIDTLSSLDENEINFIDCSNDDDYEDYETELERQSWEYQQVEKEAQKL